MFEALNKKDILDTFNKEILAQENKHSTTEKCQITTGFNYWQVGAMLRHACN